VNFVSPSGKIAGSAAFVSMMDFFDRLLFMIHSSVTFEINAGETWATHRQVF
jgi:hypothetical protein